MQFAKPAKLYSDLLLALRRELKIALCLERFEGDSGFGR